MLVLARGIVGARNITVTNSASAQSSTTSFSATMDFGTDFTDRLIVVLIATRAGSALGTVTSLTIGGQSATVPINDNGLGGDTGMALGYARGMTGTSGTVSFSASGTGSRRNSVGLITLMGVPSSSSPATASGGGSTVPSFTVASGECAVVGFSHAPDPGPGTLTTGGQANVVETTDAAATSPGARLRAGYTITADTGTIVSSPGSTFNGYMRALFSPS